MTHSPLPWLQTVLIALLSACGNSAPQAPEPASEPVAVAEPPSTTAPSDDGTNIYPDAETALAAGVAASEETFVFYLHGAIVEGSDGRPSHPERGTYEYQAIVDAMAETRVVVLSEIRPARTDVQDYANRVIDQVRALLKAGAPPERITVVGFSKGGIIALLANHGLEHDDLGFVIIGACGEWLKSTPLNLRGRVLSIHEASDRMAESCRSVVERSSTQPFFHEIQTDIGKGHGSFFAPGDAWLPEAMLWSHAPALIDRMSTPQRLDEGSTPEGP